MSHWALGDKRFDFQHKLYSVGYFSRGPGGDKFEASAIFSLL